MRKNQNKKSGQTMVEYIIIVGIVAIAALAIFGVFSDTIKDLLSGAVTSIGGDQTAAQTATQTKSQDFLKSLRETGANNSGN